MNFLTTLIAVGIMLLYAVPAYVLRKVGLVSEKSLKDISCLLLYICQPCLMAYSFMGVTYDSSLLPGLGLALIGSTVIQIGLLGLFYVIFFKRMADKASSHVYTLASVLGNIGFFGIPLLEALFPDHPETLLYAMMYIVSMNVISWTLGLYVITSSRKYITAKGLFLNPPMIALLVIVPLFLCKVTIPAALASALTILAKMTTPVCMFILGIRLANQPLSLLVRDKRSFLSVGLKMVAMPLITFALLYFLPIPSLVKTTLFVLAACPGATIVLQFAEIHEARPDLAAINVLDSTLVSIVTLPLLMLLV